MRIFINSVALLLVGGAYAFSPLSHHDTARVSKSSKSTQFSQSSVDLFTERKCQHRFGQTATSLASLSSEESDGLFSGLEFNALYSIPYFSFLIFAFFMASGEAPGASQAVLEKFLADPINPGVNELFASVFNLLGLVAFPMACLVMPASKDQKLPAPLFLAGSAFAGYGSLGILMSTWKPKTEVSQSDIGWVTKNIFENKVFNWILVTVAFSVFYSTGLVAGMIADPTAELQGYADLFAATAICSASSCDLAILTLTMASLIPEDLKRRGVEDSGKAYAIAASTLLLPVVGSALYCALRPALPEE